MSKYSTKSGDIIGFSGRCLNSIGINIATGGTPLWGVSHVGVIGRTFGGKKLLYESAKKGLPCEITGKSVEGVQAHYLHEVMERYSGRVWKYSLHRPLYKHEKTRLTIFLTSIIGFPYDLDGARQSGGFFYALLNGWIRGQNLDKLFCSETVAAANSYIGIFPTTNASRWNPNKYIRALRRAGVIKRPERLK